MLEHKKLYAIPKVIRWENITCNNMNFPVSMDNDSIGFMLVFSDKNKAEEFASMPVFELVIAEE